MENLNLQHLIVSGESNAARLAGELVRRSQWFTFEPLPDDEYEFQFKTEIQPMVRAILQA